MTNPILMTLLFFQEYIQIKLEVIQPVAIQATGLEEIVPDLFIDKVWVGVHFNSKQSTLGDVPTSHAPHSLR